MTTPEYPEFVTRISPNYPDDFIRASEARGETWESMSDAALIGMIGHVGDPLARDACAAEMQRRMVVSVRAFSSEASAQTAKLVSLAEETGKQTEMMIRLTWAIAGLTVVIAVLTGVMVWKGLA